MATKSTIKKWKTPTPKGRAVFPRINGKPDMKFDKVNGEWRIRVVISITDAADLMAALDAEHDLSLESARREDPKKKWKKGSKPYTVLDNGTDVQFSFVMKAQYTDSKTKEIVARRPVLFGADGKPLPANAPIIGSDSIVRVGFSTDHTVFGSNAHVKLYLNAVQVIDLIPYQADGSKYGFDDETGEDESEFAEDAEETEEVEAVEEEAEEETPAPTPTDRVAAKKADKAKAKAKAEATDF
jgi:hypothetical protein